MTKTNNMAVRPAKTQISLGIRPVWSESLLSAWRKSGSLATHKMHSKDSDQTGWTGRTPRLIWVLLGTHSFCWFCHEVAQLVHILSPVTDNCPTWVRGRERMTFERISLPNLHERMFHQILGANLRPSAHQAEVHATEVSALQKQSYLGLHCLPVRHILTQ